MPGEFLVRGIYVRLVIAGRADPRLEVVGHEGRRHALKESERAHVRGDPVRQRLRPGSFRERVAGGTQGRDKDLGFPRQPCLPVHYRNGHPGVVHEEFVSRPVHLVEAWFRSGLAPALVLLAEPAIAESLGPVLPVLLPEQLQGHALLTQLPVNDRPVRQRTFSGGGIPGRTAGLHRWEKLALQFCFRQLRRQRPG